MRLMPATSDQGQVQVQTRLVHIDGICPNPECRWTSSTVYKEGVAECRDIAVETLKQKHKTMSGTCTHPIKTVDRKTLDR